MSSAGASRSLVTQAVFNRLELLVATAGGPGVLAGPRVTIYLGEAPTAPPLATVDGEPDPEGRVAPYAVLYPSSGDVNRHPSLSRTPAAGGPNLLWSAQVTFTAGRLPNLEHTLDRAVPLLHGWVPTIPGLACGPLTPDGTGQIRRSDDVTPPRFYVPTLWVMHVASTR